MAGNSQRRGATRKESKKGSSSGSGGQRKQGLEGKGPTLTSLKGQVVVLRVWATWCGPCRKSVPEVKRLFAKYKDRGLAIVSIHTTRGGENAAAFVKEHQVPWPVGVDDADKTANVLGAVAGKPDYYLIDRAGILRFADIEEVELERAMKLLLGETPAAP